MNLQEKLNNRYKQRAYKASKSHWKNMFNNTIKMQEETNKLAIKKINELSKQFKENN